jgi:hypothetical protein
MSNPDPTIIKFSESLKDKSAIRRWFDQNPGYAGGIAALVAGAGCGVAAAFDLGRYVTAPAGGLDFSGLGELLDNDLLNIGVWLAGIWLIPNIVQALNKKLPFKRRRDNNSVMLKNGRYKDL